MDNSAIINELQTLQAHFESGSQRAARLIKKLQPVSTGRSKNQALSPEQRAKLLAKKRKTIVKNAV